MYLRVMLGIDLTRPEMENEEVILTSGFTLMDSMSAFEVRK